MQPTGTSDLLLGFFNLGGGEIIPILALAFFLSGAKKLPELGRGLGQGINNFREAADEVANEAGRSAGGIYGKRAAHSR